MDDQKKAMLKSLPKIDELMSLLEKKGVLASAQRNLVKSISQVVVDGLRQAILGGGKDKDVSPSLPALERAALQVEREVQSLSSYRLRRVVNATGIILHTNLGRATLCPEAIERLVKVGGSYSNVEFDLETGKRGIRYDHVRRLLCALSGAEDALVVNNNAAAVLLVLNTFAEGKGAIVSRGELIEIGGEFRIPEVMEKSGARLLEVGSTNRTRLSDYEKGLASGETGLILKVHTSNFRIVGFTEETKLEELISLGEKYHVPVMDDLGSGCFIELDRYGLEREPTVQEVIATGVDVVTFSGDKLMGGPQAGIILGKEKILQKIKKNPLNRALRIDKLTLAALEATMMQYLQPEKAATNLRVLRALTEPLDTVTRRARKLLAMLKKSAPEGVKFSIKQGTSLAGGGALPARDIPTALLSIRSEILSPNTLEASLRGLEVPVIVRIADDEVLFDLRTVDEKELVIIRDAMKTILPTTGNM